MNEEVFSHVVKLDRLPGGVEITANAAERAALARRFALHAVHSLHAELTLSHQGDAIDARGRLRAVIEQICAISTEPFTTELDEPIAVRFVPTIASYAEEDEIEFDSDAPDEIEHDGAAIDIGEAIAQSFGLAIDPYAKGPDADTIRREAGLLDENAPSGPFAALAALKLGTGES